MGDRECSLQRRYQKVVEEAPAASISAETRDVIYQASRRLLTAVGYSGAATVEFLVGPDGAAYFLEVNTRLQVEHPVTELVHGIDLVGAQIELAHGGALPEIAEPRGHAIEVRRMPKTRMRATSTDRTTLGTSVAAVAECSD